MTTDYADYATPQAHADHIFATGVPLYSKSVTVVNDVAHAVPLGGGTVTVANLAPISQIGYEIAVTSLIAAGASTIPVLTVNMIWRDSVTNTVVGHETWNVVMGSAGNGSLHIGTGPTKGNLLTVTVANNDSAANATVTTVVNQNSRVYNRDDWRTEEFNTIPNVAIPFHDQQGNTLMQFLSGALGANGQVTRLAALYAGRVTISGFSTISAKGTLRINSLDPAVGASAEYISLALPALATAVPVTLSLPRAACTVTLQDASGLAGNIIQANIVIEEYLP